MLGNSTVRVGAGRGDGGTWYELPAELMLAQANQTLNWHETPSSMFSRRTVPTPDVEP
jgi:hypothetical protein